MVVSLFPDGFFGACATSQMVLTGHFLTGLCRLYRLWYRLQTPIPKKSRIPGLEAYWKGLIPGITTAIEYKGNFLMELYHERLENTGSMFNPKPTT